MFKEIRIDTASPKQPTSSLLLIYTGGTMGMIDNGNGSLVPFNFEHIIDHIPSLKSFDIHLTVISFDEPIDSSNVNPSHWADIGNIIHDNYSKYDGFVILHGTDTMAYTASALSYMLGDLSKPVILTGAQLPIAAPRTDARENLISALEIASAKENGQPIVPEVCIYFDSVLLRGNRSRKVESTHFDAFESENYPILAEAGIMIEYNKKVISKVPVTNELSFSDKFDQSVALLKLFPGISQSMVSLVLGNPEIKGVVLETFGSGNAPTTPWFTNILKNAIEKGVIILNVSQCNGGKVLQGRYATSKHLYEIGVLSGSDITSEAAITKMMFLLAGDYSVDELKYKITKPLCGEMT